MVEDESRRLGRRAACDIFFGPLSLYLLTAGGSLSSTDATVMFDLTRSIVEQPGCRVADHGQVRSAERSVHGSGMTRDWRLFE